ncbi:putative exported protein [Lysobacter dokdonensis DS-58]|uniref:Putative exported protein n=1 Tax=Lysobacter dokdonensis DS-58 TaxID=1300345 RepID=A0A0A2WHJ5_9GAMM|nr:glycine zipper 2TM domain-containing protein [Lysobacter dokdonensis]KGQ17720.1 putative exported protein [Lysobacter dokdonensis DS-58]
MKRLSATLLALGLAAAVGTASAQNYGGYSNGGYSNVPQQNAIYDWARVVRVDPVIDSRYSNNRYNANNGYNNTYASNGQRCYSSGGRHASNGGYTSNGGYYPSNDPYDPQQGRYGTDTGRTVATVVGGLAGAVLGSKVGGGSGQVAAAAIGSMVGGLAGRQIYEGTQRRKYESSSVTVCDDQYGNDTGYVGNDGYRNYNANDGRVVGYDVTYEYNGRQFMTRTQYHPGDRIRVRVDVRPE